MSNDHPLAVAMQDTWSLLSEQDISEIATQQDLIRALQRRYTVPADEATMQVQAWSQGRGFGF
jgi:hypothetical protein